MRLTKIVQRANFSKKKYLIPLLLLLLHTTTYADNNKFIVSYRVETLGEVSNGELSPLWFTANRFGTMGVADKQANLRTGLFGSKKFKHNWKIDTGVELVGGSETTSKFWVHQAFFDVSWKKLNLSIGNKERFDFPLTKNTALTSGWMVEGMNTRPIPQIRLSIDDYLPIPGMKNWLAFKGHLAYGWFTDGKWQKDYVDINNNYVQDVLYHSKSLMFRIGNKKIVPLELEFGVQMAAQFGGDMYYKNPDGSSSLVINLPKGLKAYWKAFAPQPGDENSLLAEQLNIEGNILGSWNFALNWYAGNWKTRVYLEHYFEDPSQILWEYGRWKDGLLGIEITLPKNRFISSILWEGMGTKDQTSPVFVRDKEGPFPDISMRGDDNYYNHYLYQSWQQYGLGIGHPLIPGPIYTQNGTLNFRSNRAKIQHIGLQGSPSEQISWRILASFASHWGIYRNPLDKERKQTSCLLEVVYKPSWTKGWSVSASLGLDRGDYPGDSTGGMLSICKKGDFSL